MFCPPGLSFSLKEIRAAEDSRLFARCRSRADARGKTSMTKELPRLRHVSSKHVEGISDLVVVAPVKEGFIDAFEQVSYETRLKMTMEALFRMRSTSREFNLLKPLLDTVEKIQSLRSYRLAVIDVATDLEVVKKLVLAVTFDKPFEPYIREIWWPLGPMLDVLFC